MPILKYSMLRSYLNFTVHIIAQLFNQSFQISKRFSFLCCQNSQNILKNKHSWIIPFQKANIIFIKFITRIFFDILSHSRTTCNRISLTRRPSYDDINFFLPLQFIYIRKDVTYRFLSNRCTNYLSCNILRNF